MVASVKLLKFNLIEVILVAMLVGTTGWVAGRGTSPAPLPSVGFLHPEDIEIGQRLMAQYGPDRFSEGPEEWIIRDFFQDRRGGTFADIGAWHAETGSNTFYLERHLEWSGVAVDASPEYVEEWRQKRPRSRMVVAFADAVDGEPRTLYVVDDSTSVSSVSRDFVSLFRRPTRTIQGKSATLDNILSQAGIQKLDFLSMDIELGEPAALQGFSIGRFEPALVCIEAHPPVRQQILDYFADAGYVLIGKYTPVDRTNYYFSHRER